MASLLIEAQRDTARRQIVWARVTQLKCRKVNDLVGEAGASERIDKALDKLLELRGR